VKVVKNSEAKEGTQDGDAISSSGDSKGVWTRLVKFGFHLLYNELAFTYDAVSWVVSQGLWREWQKTVLPYVKGENILEIAHGTGHLLLELERNGYRVFGIDQSSNMIRIASQRLSAFESAATLAYAQSQALPFKKESFSSVLTTFPSEFLADPETFKNCWRVLEADGRFIALLGARFTGKTIVSIVLEWLYRVTGQRIAIDQSGEIDMLDSWLARVLPPNMFNYTIDQVSIDESQTTVIILTKVGQS
jgi:ubiquinone/menaquinone biosynthesis C-methylase UbiE